MNDQLGQSGDDGVGGVINANVLGLDRVNAQEKPQASGSTFAFKNFDGNSFRNNKSPTKNIIYYMISN